MLKRKARIPASIRKHVMQTFECCVVCGQWDANDCGHIVPESQGGAMTASNFVRLCGYCNQTQGACVAKFGAYAGNLDHLSVPAARALIQKRRKQWAKYCGMIRARAASEKKFRTRPFTPCNP